MLTRPLIATILSVLLAAGEMGVASASPQQGGSIRVVSGQGTELVIGSPELKDVVVQVVDAAGQPVPGVTVTFIFPGAGRTGGATDLNQFLATAISDSQGRASVRVKQSGPAGAWALRVTAGGAAATVNMNDVAAETRPGPGTNGPSQPSGNAGAVTQPPPKKSHLLLILLIVAGAAGAGAAVALAGKKSSSNNNSGGGGNTGGGNTGGGTTAVSITLGSGGGFGTPAISH